MDWIIYLLTLLISFSGLLLGVILSNIAIEEIDLVATYLRYINILLITAVIFLATFKINLIYSAVFATLVLISLITFRNKYRDVWIYSILGVCLYVSAINDELMNISIIIFIYGLSITTIAASTKFKNKINGQRKLSENLTFAKSVVLKHSGFLILGILAYIIFSVII